MPVTPVYGKGSTPNGATASEASTMMGPSFRITYVINLAHWLR
jgi:hypothetical protein